MQRRATETTRGPDAAEVAWQRWLKERDCCACGATGPSDVHHVAGATFRHNHVLVGHRFCVPLCRHCHNLVGDHKAVFLRAYGPQWRLWWREACDYERQGGAAVPADQAEAILECGL